MSGDDQTDRESLAEWLAKTGADVTLIRRTEGGGDDPYAAVRALAARLRIPPGEVEKLIREAEAGQD